MQINRSLFCRASEPAVCGRVVDLALEYDLVCAHKSDGEPLAWALALTTFRSRLLWPAILDDRHRQSNNCCKPSRNDAMELKKNALPSSPQKKNVGCKIHQDTEYCRARLRHKNGEFSFKTRRLVRPSVEPRGGLSFC